MPFELFIKAISGRRVIPINERGNEDKVLIATLKEVVKNAILELNNVGIGTKRPNEAGNKAETFLKSAIEKSSLKLQSLSQSAGYPDLLILDEFNRPTYIEVKTYNIDSVESSFRSFFVSPAKRKSKIEFDARHLLVSFQLEKKDGRFYAEKASVYDIAFLMGEVKREFNSSNKELYASPRSRELFSLSA
ncbi:MAG: hypothetical protein NZM06_05045 [Chloroherpetonaceae bacterium]|nr:hypothetical protein [Chloroherpetonaceae bacterium]